MPSKKVGESCMKDLECRNKNCVKNVCARRNTKKTNRSTKKSKSSPKKVGESCIKDLECRNKNCVKNVCTRRNTKISKSSRNKPSPNKPSRNKPSPNKPSRIAKVYNAEKNEIKNERNLISTLVSKQFQNGDIIINQDNSEEFYVFMKPSNRKPYLGYIKEGNYVSMPLIMTSHTDDFYLTYSTIFFDPDTMPHLQGEFFVQYNDRMMQKLFKTTSSKYIYKIEILLNDENVKFSEVDPQTNKVLREKERVLRI